MSSRFNQAKRTQQPPPVCHDTKKPPVDELPWPGPEMIASITWYYNTNGTPGQTLDAQALASVTSPASTIVCVQAIIPLRQLRMDETYRGNWRSGATELSIEAALNPETRTLAIVAVLTTPGPKTFQATWLDVPADPRKPLDTGALWKPPGNGPRQVIARITGTTV
jgi:hypothetical protein